jgi:hypothetical protein
MQGWLSSASALGLASATLLSGKLTSVSGEAAYLAMAALAATGFLFAVATFVLRRSFLPLAE